MIPFLKVICPFVKQDEKKSKHKGRMDQKEFAFPFSKIQELKLAVHNSCVTLLQVITAEIMVQNNNKA